MVKNEPIVRDFLKDCSRVEIGMFYESQSYHGFLKFDGMNWTGLISNYRDAIKVKNLYDLHNFFDVKIKYWYEDNSYISRINHNEIMTYTASNAVFQIGDIRTFRVQELELSDIVRSYFYTYAYVLHIGKNTYLTGFFHRN
jgi:hypothetical protein